MHDTEGLTPEAAQRLFDWTAHTYINPEIERRQEAGEWPAGTPLYLAQIVFNLDGPPQVRLNAEAKGTGLVKAARAMKKGEEVGLGDIAGWKRFELSEEDPDAAHITLLRYADGWASPSTGSTTLA